MSGFGSDVESSSRSSSLVSGFGELVLRPEEGSSGGGVGSSFFFKKHLWQSQDSGSFSLVGSSSGISGGVCSAGFWYRGKA